MISERLFEFGINRELFKCVYNIYIPSQKEEGILGYDSKVISDAVLNKLLDTNAKIKILLFQYKIPKIVNVKNKYIANYKKIKHLPWSDDEVFTYNLHYKNKEDLLTKKKIRYYYQHNILKEMINMKGAVAFYCSPKFLSNSEFLKYSENNKVIENSVFIRLNDLPKLKPKSHIHKMYYDKTGLPRKLCSEEFEFLNERCDIKVVVDSLNEAESVNINYFIDKTYQIICKSSEETTLTIKTDLKEKTERVFNFFAKNKIQAILQTEEKEMIEF